MSALNCLDFLNNYADTLDSNAGIITGFRPRPVFFSGTNCSGTLWPPGPGQITDNLIAGVTYDNPASDQFGSMYIPGGWQVTLTSKGGFKAVFPKNVSQFPTLLTDVSTESSSNSEPLTNNVLDAEVTLPINPDKSTFTDTEWQLAMCTSQISTVVGARHLNSWQQGSRECDVFMNGFCQPVANMGCAPNSTEPQPLPNQYKPCVCLVEENCLRETFCEPGNTNSECANQDAFQEFIPVTCFGKLCSVEGYRFGRMQNQRCTITLCQQVINLIGENITVKGGSTIWCGNRSVPVTSVSPSAPQKPKDDGAIGLPVWAWVLVGVAVFVIFVTVPIAVIVYRRALKREIKNSAPSERSGLQQARKVKKTKTKTSSAADQTNSSGFASSSLSLPSTPGF